VERGWAVVLLFLVHFYIKIPAIYVIQSAFVFQILSMPLSQFNLILRKILIIRVSLKMPGRVKGLHFHENKVKQNKKYYT